MFTSAITRVLVLFSILFACNSYAEPKVAASRFLYLKGVITGQTIAPLSDALDAVIGLGDSNRQAVTLVINSPGGGVVAGNMFINRMTTVKALGIQINCYVTDVAASMAFQILTQCSSRTALPTSYLLWHGVRTGTDAPITAASALAIAADIQRMDDVVMYQLTGALDLDEETIAAHFANETLWSGIGLHSEDSTFLSLRDGYPRLLPMLPKATQMGAMQFSFFGQAPSIERFQYVWSDWKSHVNN